MRIHENNQLVFQYILHTELTYLRQKMVIKTDAFYIIAFKHLSAGFESPITMILVAEFKLDSTGTYIKKMQCWPY
jgi:hypothetical protein